MGERRIKSPPRWFFSILTCGGLRSLWDLSVDMGRDVRRERRARSGDEAMSDTSVEVEERFLKLMLARSPAERLAMACRMFSTAKALVRAGIKEEHVLATLGN